MFFFVAQIEVSKLFSRRKYSCSCPQNIASRQSGVEWKFVCLFVCALVIVQCVNKMIELLLNCSEFLLNVPGRKFIRPLFY